MAISSILVGLVLLGASSQQGGSPPPFPVTFKGTVTVQGSPAPEGLSLVACIVDCKDYETIAAAITQAGGKYRGLVVQPPDTSYVGKAVTFWIVTRDDMGNEVGRIQATETLRFSPLELTVTQDLTFPDPVPMAPEDTPTPQPSPTEPPTNTPTHTPAPTATTAPTPTATTVPPIPGDPSVPQLSRLAVFIGIGALAAGAFAIYLARRRNKAV
jgi:hypothetical protein